MGIGETWICLKGDAVLRTLRFYLEVDTACASYTQGGLFLR